MIIVNKDKTDAYNISHIVNMYIGADGNSVKVCAGNATRGGILGRYNSYEDAIKAFEILLEGISRNISDVLYMPSDSEVSDKIKIQPRELYHHISGKKTKGHGGS